ncbi:hypothetical protein SEVIR_8G190701v4 [Setaria viridis]
MQTCACILLSICTYTRACASIKFQHNEALYIRFTKRNRRVVNYQNWTMAMTAANSTAREAATRAAAVSASTTVVLAAFVAAARPFTGAGEINARWRRMTATKKLTALARRRA